MWLKEDDDDNGTADDPSFGAFAGGGTAVTATTYGGAVVTGTATYNGAAAGVYTAGGSVDYFQGDATLTADFGTPGTASDPEADDDYLGTITGRIDNIMAGGMAMDDVIYLNDDRSPATGNITATGGLTGDARMGMGTTVDDSTIYPYNGFWSGQFYNGTADDTETDDVNESHAAPAPSSAPSVTGGEGEGDDAITRSYVGAFGAQKE